MKFRYIFAMIAASLTFLLTGCQEEERFLDEVKVSSSYVTIPIEGGQSEITVTAADTWEITGVPEWLTVTPTSGAAGETKVTFKAGATSSNQEALLYLNCAGATQIITVHQVLKVETISPISDVLAAQAGTFRIKGEVYGIYNTQYGNFYMKDETGSILIYGCLDANGAEKNFSSLGIDNGDVITCEGPLTIYNGTYELVNVTVLDIEKSLLKFEEVVYGEAAEGEDAPTAIALEGGSAKVILTTKTGGVNVEIPEGAKSWLSVGGVNIDGTTATVTLNATANNAGDRSAELTFVTEQAGKTYSAVVTIAQKGSALSFDEFMALENDALGTIEGIVTGVHKKGFVLSNSAKQGLYVYVNDVPEVVLGDKVVASGKKSVYNKCYQVAEPTYSVISSENEVSYPTPAQCTDDLWAEMISEENPSFSAKLVKVSGEPTGDYGDIAFGDGCSLSPYQTSADFNYPAAFEGKTVTIIGYVLQVYTKNGAKTLRVLPVSIKEATDEDLAEPTYTDVVDLTALVAGGAEEYDVNLKDAVVTYVNGKNAFIEDATGGILLYTENHGLEAGQKITGPVSGVATVYNNLPELTSMDYSGASIKSGAEIPCTELTIAELLADYNKYVSSRVILKGVTVTDGVNLDDRDGVISQGGAEVALRSQDKKTVVVETNKVGDLICYPTVYNDKKQVGIWENGQFTEGGGNEGGNEGDEPVAVTIEEFNAMEDGAWGQLSGIIEVDNFEYGSFTLKDETGSTYIWGLASSKGGENDFLSLGLKSGDKLTLAGQKATPYGAPEVANAYYISHESRELETPDIPVGTVSDLAAMEDGAWLRMTGTVKKVTDKEFGSLEFFDETGSVFVGGLIGTGATYNDRSFQYLGVQEGDLLTILGQKTTVDGKVEISLAKYISHKPGEGMEVPAVTVDGKQWLADMGGVKLLVDLGASEEGMMMVGMSADGSEYVLYENMVGSYVATPTDAASGTVIFTPVDLSTGDFGTPMSLPYSDLTETSLKVTAPDLFGVEDPVPFNKAGEYIEIAIPGEGGGGDVTENSIENGDYWIVTGGKAATPVAESKKYDYLGSEDMIDGASYAKNVFTFTYNADETRYTIQDSYGRYLYGQGTYNNFNVSATLPEKGAYWSVVERNDGTYDIYNGETGFSISFANGKWEQRDPDAENFSGVYPTLVKAENPLADPVEQKPVDKTNVNPEIVDANKAYKETAVIDDVLTTVYKIGTSKLAGSFDITVPAGSTKVSCYAVAWKGSSATVQVKMGDTVVASQAISANDGATSNAPYTITSADTDKYVIQLGQALQADTKFTLTTSDKARVLFWSIIAE